MKYNIIILAVCQALGLAAPPMIILIGGIIGTEMASNVSLSTLPLAMQIIGVAVFTVPAALLMGKIGRRAGFIAGTLLAIISSLGAIYAISANSFPLFCISLLGIGGNMAFVQQYRFAAAESVEQAYVGRAVSWVLVGGVAAAFIGPALAENSKDWLPYGSYSGSFAALVILYIVNIVLLSFLRVKTVETVTVSAEGRPLCEIIRGPLFVTAVMAGLVSLACMTFVMTATPVSMHVIDGFSLKDTAWVIQSHVMAMFIPSFFSGALIDRYGIAKVMLAGCFLNVLCVCIAVYDQHLIHYWGSLVAIGVGWNFLYVGGTTLLTKSYRAGEQFKSQAFNDFVIFGFQAVASLSAGAVIFHAGWKAVNLITLPLLFVMVVFVIRLPRYLKESNISEQAH